GDHRGDAGGAQLGELGRHDPAVGRVAAGGVGQAVAEAHVDRVDRCERVEGQHPVEGRDDVAVLGEDLHPEVGDVVGVVPGRQHADRDDVGSGGDAPGDARRALTGQDAGDVGAVLAAEVGQVAGR